MEILQTITRLRDPWWVPGLIVMGIAGFLCFALYGLATNFKSEYGLPLGIILSLMTVVGGIILATTNYAKIPDYNEYDVRLTTITAKDFAQSYEVIETYEYSDVIRVKERK